MAAAAAEAEATTVVFGTSAAFGAEVSSGVVVMIIMMTLFLFASIAYLGFRVYKLQKYKMPSKEQKEKANEERVGRYL